MATLADVLRQTGYAQDGTLAAPATDSPMTRALSEHIKTLPQQLATNQAALDSAINSWNKTDFGTGQPNPNYRPEAIAELTQLMPNIGGLTAWHGTPHKIQGAFDIAKVGTGEGAQAYGHGMYFAENPDVAKMYQAALSNPKYISGGRELKGNDAWAAQFLHDFQGDALPKRIDVDTAVKNAKNVFKSNETEAEIINKIKELDKAGLTVENGNLYKVDIPDEQIPNMLDWDKPLNQQSKVVQDAYKKALALKGDPYNIKRFKDPVGADFYHAIAGSADQAPKEASEYLNNLGIKGIRYLDEGSRSKGGGTSNFVVFDPSTVKILEENSKPVSRKALIEEQVNKLKD